jgi:hypothetical protein
MKKGDQRKQRRSRPGKDNRSRHSFQPASPRRVLREARSYRMEGCWTFRDWQKTGMAPVVIARRQPNGALAFGVYLIDYYLLGVKDTYFNVNVPRYAFYDEILPDTLNQDPFEIPSALAHEMIYGSIDYAQQFGFPPHRDFRDTRYLLDLAETHPRSGVVTFGYDGKPFYVQGPHDRPEAILRRLDRTVGEGNYHFLLAFSDPDGVGVLPEGWDAGDDDWDDKE